MSVGARLSRRVRPDVVVGGLIALAVTAMACLQLFWGGDLGLGDNGDVRRVLCAADLQPAPLETKFGPVVFEVAPMQDATAGACDNEGLRYSTSQALLVDAVRVVDGLVSAPGIDLRAVGALSALLFGLGVGLLYVALPGGRAARLLAVAVGTFLLLDVTYLHFFSSGYSEAAGFLGLLWTTVALAWLGRGPMGFRPVLATVAAGAFLITAKSQLTPLAALLVLALAARWVADRHEPGRLRRTGLAVGASLALALTAGAYLGYQGPAFHDVNVHNLVMHTVLPLTDDPAAALEEMGLDPAMAPHTGSTAFDTVAWGQPEHEAFLRDADRTAVLRYLAAHPSVAGPLLETGLRESTQTRLPYLAELSTPDVTGSHAATDRHDLPGRFLASTRDVAPVLLPAVWSSMCGWGVVLLAVRRFRERGSLGWALPLLFSGAAAAAQAVIALLGDGVWEISKHSIYVSWLTFLALALTAGSVVAVLRRPDPMSPEPRPEEQTRPVLRLPEPRGGARTPRAARSGPPANGEPARELAEVSAP